MKSKLITILLCVCLVACVLFAAGCNNTAELEQQVEDLQQQISELTEDKAELEQQTEQLQQQLSDLKEQNTLTEEQFAVLQQKVEKFLDLPWHYEPGYALYMFHVIIKPEYSNRDYTVEDFLPARLSSIEKSSALGDNWYMLYIDVETVSVPSEIVYRFFSAVITVLGFEFVDYIYFVINGQGA